MLAVTSTSRQVELRDLHLMYLSANWGMMEQAVAINYCIWCHSSAPSTLEHIIPESLGCPSWFVLEQGVCEGCNSAFGTLDAALLKPFELMTFIKNIPRKGGKPPTISQHSSFKGASNSGGSHLYFNREPHRVEYQPGRFLGPSTRSDPISEFEFASQGNGKGSISTRHRFDFNRNAVRCLFKIALESIAFHSGLEFVRSEKFDAIRQFARFGSGSYKAIQLIAPHYENISAEIDAAGNGIVSINILGLLFICDFDPSFKNGKNLIAIARLMNAWPSRLPNC